jgi:hydroxylysine kinase
MALVTREGQGSDSLLHMVEEHFGISIVDHRSLGGELDTNVYVRDEGGREFTVKRSLCQDPADVRWQYGVLAHLSERLVGIGVPTLELTRTGEFDVALSHPKGWLVTRLVRWVPGTIVGSLSSPTPEILRQWGHMAANTVLALSDYPHDSVPSTHHWDVRNSLRVIEECIPFVREPNRREAVQRLVDWAEPAVAWLRDGPRQVVHQDLNDFNLLVDDQAEHIVGLLDVGDAIYAPRLAELAVAGAYGMLRQSDPNHAFSQVIDGYMRVLALDNVEIDQVRKLAALRLCVNATTWTMRDHVTGTEYGQRRMAATWPAIEALARTSAVGDF